MIKFAWYEFNELTTKKLYEILALRAEIFVVEQRCAYLDPDGKDNQALHLLGTDEDMILAYLRLFPPCTFQSKSVFGRVVVAKSVRGKGYGKVLLRTLLDYCDAHFSDVAIQCSAQYYLKPFYESFGFNTYGDVYLEDEIPHIGMMRNP